MYAIKNLKTGPSREYGPKGSYTCTIYKDGKKVGSAFEAGDGGEVRIDFPKRTDLQAYQDFCKKQTYFCPYGKKTTTHSIDTYLSELVGAFEENKQLKSWCRTKIVLKLEGSKEGEFAIYKCKFTERNLSMLKDRHNIVEVINERFGKAIPSPKITV